MKNQIMSLIETMAMVAFLGLIWFVYAHYFLVENPDGTYDLFNNGNSIAVLTVAIAISIVIILGFGYMVICYFQSWFNGRSSSKIMSRLASDLSRLYLDSNFISHCAKFGIEMNHQTIAIKPEIIDKCSLNDLARLIVFIFNKNISLDFDFDKIFFSLADLIIEAWPEEVTAEFVELVYNESIVIGEQLRYAVDYQKVNKEVSAFNKDIEGRLAEIEQKHSEKSKATSVKIDAEFKDYDYLINGGSAISRFLREKLSFQKLLLRGLWKQATAK